MKVKLHHAASIVFEKLLNEVVIDAGSWTDPCKHMTDDRDYQLASDIGISSIKKSIKKSIIFQH